MIYIDLQVAQPPTSILWMQFSLLQEDNSVHTHNEAKRNCAWEETAAQVQGIIQVQILTHQSPEDFE